MSEGKSQKTKESKGEAPGWLLDNIAEASKNARKIYLLYIGFLAYCALTVVSTTDRQIVLNEPARLPIIDVEVALNGFFLLSPLLAIFVFIYFQIYLNKLKRLTDDLRLNYAPVAQGRLYPWLLNFAEEIEKGFVGTIQRFIVNFSLWWSLPLVLLLIALWYIKKHDLFLCQSLVIISVIGTVIVAIFRYHYSSEEKEFYFKKNKYWLGLRSLIVLAQALLIFFVIPAALRGEKTILFGSWTNVDLSYEALINENLKDYETLYLVDLKGANLNGANLVGAILDRADLKGASLRRANLTFAHLKRADLSKANLNSVYLSSAQLQGAVLAFAQLRDANLEDAQLGGANLQHTNLDRADLFEANLDSADLSWAELQGASLVDTQLRGADLERAQLQGAFLERAHLQGANLFGANLDSAHLGRAQLQGAKNLTVVQLAKVKTLFEAKLDSSLLIQIKRKYPHLLKATRDAILTK